MKVNEALNNSSNIIGIAGKEDKKVVEGREPAFHGQLKRIEGQNHEDRIKELAAKIFEQGEKLGKKIDIRELKIYKRLISEFLDEAVNKSRKFSKESFLDRRGRYRAYANVKKINAELDKLTEEVLKQEQDNINVLRRIDDIRGLIMDLTL